MSSYVDSAGPGSVTVVSAIDRGPYTDLLTPKSVTTLSASIEDFTHPTGTWGPFDTDSGQL